MSTKSQKSNPAAKKTHKAKSKRVVSDVIVHIYASYNNTIVAVTDLKGKSLTWSTAGKCGFSGSRQSTPYAAQMAAVDALGAAKEQYLIQNAIVKVRGPGPGRDAAIRMVRDYVFVCSIYDVTGIPFNGCREPGERRM